jgi:hypothetical protein
MDIPLLPACWPSPRPYPSPLCWEPTFTLALFLYSWLFPTGGSVCSHLLTLVPRWRIFIPWRWRLYVPPKRRLTQDRHSVTPQKTTSFMFRVCLSTSVYASGYSALLVITITTKDKYTYKFLWPEYCFIFLNYYRNKICVLIQLALSITA